MRRPCPDTTSSQMGLTGGRHQRGRSVFGVSLKTNQPVPTVLITLCKFINKYSVESADITSCNTKAKQQLLELLERCPSANIDDTVTSLPAVIAVLQCFFTELPEPLFTEATAQRLIAAILDGEDVHICDGRMRAALKELPAPNLRVVEYLATQFSGLSISAPMGAALAPSVFRLKEKKYQHQANNVLTRIIQRHPFILEDHREGVGRQIDRAPVMSQSFEDLKCKGSPHGGRKRKEHDQPALEMKMSRSSSEERPGTVSADLRRVCSDGDMLADIPKNTSNSNVDAKDPNCQPVSCDSNSKENVCPNRDDDEYHPAVDLSKAVEDEPVLSYESVFTDNLENATLSPRGSFFLAEDRESSWSRELPSPPVNQMDRSSNRINTRKINKKIKSLKGRLRERQEKFEQEHGYRPSQADRINDPVMRELTHNLSRLRKQLKQVKDLDISDSMSPVAPILTVLPRGALPHSDTSHNTFLRVQRILSESRSLDGRGDRLEAYNSEQITEEKAALQRALLLWERVHGRASDVNSRGLIGNLYERYRVVKRIMSRSGSPKFKDSITDLQPILEHEEIVDFEQPGAVGGNHITTEEIKDVTQSKNYHEMTISELRAEFKLCQEQKKEYGRKIREWEDWFQERNGRKAQKVDRWPLKQTYCVYREVKLNMRLLEALISKSVSK